MSPFKAQLNTLLAKKMNRQDFIEHVAIGVAALTGASAALRLLSTQKQKSVDVGYGGSAYGGDKTPKTS